MSGVIAFFKDRKRDIAVRLSKLEYFLVFGRLTSSFRRGQLFVFDDHGQIAGIAFADNSLEVSTEKARSAFGG